VSFEECAEAHFVSYWQAVPYTLRLRVGRFYELPPWFRVLEFQREQTWCYATVGMSNGEPDGIEAFMIMPEQNPRGVEFLYFLAHFHRTGARLGLGHTVNFGMAIWPESNLDHGFLSFPYTEVPGFESFTCDNARTALAWVIPITSAEREYKKKNGVEALEEVFENRRLDYLDPARASLV
jgi:hypothetical protein